MQARVTDDRGALQRIKGHRQLKTFSFSTFSFKSSRGLHLSFLSPTFSLWKRKLREQLHFLYLRLWGETCNTIIQRDMFQTSQELKMMSVHCDSLWMGSLISNWDSSVTQCVIHTLMTMILCWWRRWCWRWFGFDFVHGAGRAGRGPEGVVGMGGASEPKANFFNQTMMMSWHMV